MVSEKIFHVLNNEYAVYGLKEYETKNGEPVRLIIAIHDIGRDRQSIRDVCLSLCKENTVVVTFDMINHGVRRLAQNEATPEIFFKNPNFNLDLWSYSQEVTNQISLLLGAGQDQFFGPSGNYPVKEWCLFGRGLGAIGCMISAIQEPQISTVVTVDATFEVLDWMELLVKKHHHDMETSLSENLKAVMHRYLKNKDHALQSKNMLMLNDVSSELVSLNDVFLNRMFEIRQGTNGSRSSEWKMVVMGQQDEHPVDVINGWFTNHELVPGKH